MRNYLTMYWQLIHFNAGGFDEAMVGRTAEELANNVVTLKGGDTDTTDSLVIPAYHCFDKDSLYNLLFDAPNFYWFTSVANTDPNNQPIRTVLSSPRATGWTDAAGVKRAPPPSEKKVSNGKADFSGAPGLLEALQGFLTLAGDLTELGKIRQAGIVLYAYKQVINQVWSITQAIQYLIDNRITATVGA